MNLDGARDWFVSLQDAIVARLAALDGSDFHEDAWTRPEGGGGRSRLIEDGGLFERAGVNFSDVRGERLPPSATASRPELSGRAWRAMGEGSAARSESTCTSWGSAALTRSRSSAERTGSFSRRCAVWHSAWTPASVRPEPASSTSAPPATSTARETSPAIVRAFFWICHPR